MASNFSDIGVQPPILSGQTAEWMRQPEPVPGIPPGLEYLSTLDLLHVEQVVSLTEAFIGWETNNKYLITNSAGQQIYYAFEETDACMRACCGAQRSFKIHIVDNQNQEVLTVSRDFKCCAGCGWCAGCCEGCSHRVLVESRGTFCGTIKQNGSFWGASYDILDERGETVLKVQGPCCFYDGPLCPCDSEFKLLTPEGTQQVGGISKVYAGFVREAFTKADRFKIQFPIDLYTKGKATLIGALFLIDFMFFERSQSRSNNNSNNRRRDY